jgi:MOSC domain-containing protein YiiM
MDSSSSSVPTLLEIRVGRLQSPEKYKEKLPHWPTDIGSAYWKQPVNEVEATLDGLGGNEIGYPTHIEESRYRAAMVYNELNNAFFHEHYPDHVISRGDFGENFVVNHPSLLASEVCIGDEYQIGTVKFQVTGPRKPCPKVDAAQQLKGIQQLGLENGWTGYFFRVLQPGKCHPGDEIILLSRPNPGYTIFRVANGIWGPADKQDNSKEFLTALANMEALMPRGYRDTARTRLTRLENN